MSTASIRARIKRLQARRPPPQTERSLISAERSHLRALAKGWGDPGDSEEVEALSDEEVLESARTSPARRRALLEEIYGSDDVDEAPGLALPAIRGSKLG